MKNRIFSIILSVMLSLPVAVWAVDTAVETEIEPNPVVNQLDEDIDVTENEVVTDYKQPIGKKNIAKKFLSAMGGVAISSFAIFFLLTVYNRFREQYLNAIKNSDGEVSLETPEDLDGAVKIFLDKTNWNS